MIMASIAPYPVQKGLRNWILAVVVESRPGYTPSKYGSYESDWHNSNMGILDRRRVLEVVGSSITAQEARDNGGKQ